MLRSALLFGALATMVACAEGNDDALIVLAAASLNQAMPELIERFEETSDVDIELVLGATGNLASQIENGAPADIFFSADETTVERLNERGLIVPESALIYAVGRLALIWREGMTAPESLTSLADPRYEAIAIANPELAPYGAAARAAMRAVGVWEVVEGRLVYGENVSQTYQLVRTGNADVGLVAFSVLRRESPEESLPIDANLYPAVRQAVAILRRSEHPAAVPFFEFVMSETGQTILAENGFAPAPRRSAAP